ncbi:MAG: DUF1638 domain-containing protein [Candidatus Methanomethylophilaceae archaeon]
MKIGIVACDILKREVEFLTKDDPDFTERIYLEFALHTDPPAMREKIIESVNGLKGKVDAVFLGYATCNSLEGVLDVLQVPTAMLDGADCIGALLGSDEYARQKKICIGTWFSSPGWAEEGIDGLVKELHLDSAEGYEPQFFLDMIFESYQRTLFIDPGIGDAETYRKESKDFSDTVHLKLDCTKCSLDNFRDAIKRAKELALEARAS